MKRTMLAGLLLGPVSVLLSSGISSKPRQLNAQAVAPAPSGANAAWTLKVKGDIRWQQVTPVGASLLSAGAALAALGFHAVPGSAGEAPLRRVTPPDCDDPPQTGTPPTHSHCPGLPTDPG